MNTARQIELLAATLDAQGKPDAAIEVIGTRAYLLRDFKPRKRGGGAVRRRPRAAHSPARYAGAAGQSGLAGGAAWVVNSRQRRRLCVSETRREGVMETDGKLREDRDSIVLRIAA